MFALGVHGQDGGSFGLIWQGDLHFAIEATGAEQGRIEHLGAVGGGHDHHAGGGIEAVHLGQKLVEGLFALVVGAEGRASSALPNGVDLVDEDDRGGPLAGIGKEVPTRDAPTPTNSSTKLDPVRAKNGTPASPATARAMRVCRYPVDQP